MSNEFKKCPNGHYYQGDHCQYCKSGANAATQTDSYGNQDNYDSQQTTETFNNGTSTRGGENATIVDDGTMGVGSSNSQRAGGSSVPMSGRTVFGEEDEMEKIITPNGEENEQRVLREARKLAGWLVSYTLDPLGVDFKLYEGRNIIGRDPDCNITVNDNWVSSKHAVILFRAGKYSITDSQSSHGTFVNDTDIELEPYYLQDGDMIKIGKTVFKFRASF